MEEKKLFLVTLMNNQHQQLKNAIIRVVVKADCRTHAGVVARNKICTWAGIEYNPNLHKVFSVENYGTK